MIFSTKYQHATECVGGEKPGARALQDFLLAEIDRLPGCQTVDSGIYNCRTIRGSSNRKSVHSEGRAGDTGIRTVSGKWPTYQIGEPGIREWCDRLIDHATELGVLYVIYAQKSRKPGEPWRPYRGSSPHFDHIHWEISREAAEALTPSYIKSVLTDASDPEGTGMTLSEYIDMKYWMVGKRKADYAGRMYWIDRFSTDLIDKPSFSRADIEATRSNADFIYGLQNP